MYHFSKLIKCMDCGKRYKGTKERKDRIVYFCAGYSNYGKDFCTRWKLDQDFLLELVYNHYEIELIKSGVITASKKKQIEKPEIALEKLLDRVGGVQVSPKNETLRIYFKDGTSTFISPQRQTYYAE